MQSQSVCCVVERTTVTEALGKEPGSAEGEALRSTVALTASRDRGKVCGREWLRVDVVLIAGCPVLSPTQSAALGLAIAGALALGYSNIFVTAPSPENLRTLFEFVFKVRAWPICAWGVAHGRARVQVHLDARAHARVRVRRGRRAGACAGECPQELLYSVSCTNAS